MGIPFLYEMSQNKYYRKKEKQKTKTLTLVTISIAEFKMPLIPDKNKTFTVWYKN